MRTPLPLRLGLFALSAALLSWEPAQADSPVEVVFRSQEWRELARVATQNSVASQSQMRLEEACRQGASELVTPTAASIQIGCIDAAAKSLDARNWYRSTALLRLESTAALPPLAKYLGGGVAYIRIQVFDKNTYEETVRELHKLDSERETLTSVVLDLRANGGGLISGVSEVASLFLATQTTIFQIRSLESEEIRSGVRRVRPPTTAALSTGLETMLRSARLVLLVDHETAFGAEALVQALQQTRGARLVGARTKGRATVHTVRFLSSTEYTLGLVSGMMVATNGSTWDLVGLLPDVEVRGDATRNYREPASDNWVLRALMELR